MSKLRVLLLAGLLLIAGLAFLTRTAEAMVPPGTSPVHIRPALLPTRIPPARLTVLARGFGSPDDLAIDPRTGSIYFGDFSNGAINQVGAAGGIAQAVATGFKEPEGIAVTPDGTLIVMEQKDNQIWEVTMPGGSKRLLRQLVNQTGKDGVDGITLDPAT